MQIVTDPAEMQATADKLRAGRQLIGVVMTMGALHEGHLSLVNLAREHAGTIIMTLFVNPSQFGPGEDFQRYPRPFEKDAAMARSAGVDYLFAPTPEAMYPEGFQTTVSCSGITRRFEGERRPGHFDGVATIVSKLLNITRPHVAVFGEKDAQQLALIRRINRDLDMGVQIVAAPTVRENDGLAVSSRNIYLTGDERQKAPAIHRAIQHAGEMLAAGENDLKAVAAEVAGMITENTQFKLEYAAFVDEESFEPAETVVKEHEYRLLIAAAAERVRLIDNQKFRV
ncbi:pantoate--beta-alanine ligase [Pelodictyon luteolum]|uniref:Pantothenate synthetase n=1 Tax=Chlorobium luteolum (strain DSM 273 / BCRC 81028 / 2530) TaxID=319225 RepID=PANC_CHLL3|nr:pantoate--beta-alanine ligase [Pelodictyon luteolum]Q3B2E3.1 RecName: Full=Pantothenate synthetase; Short=PS; AltName: Full=Pantoate--beta-alanine ligase; AltName: Full=Pantoate-activating enzyme [Pelodictyon luteolum DSM 273]ABB24488.1 pantothenate synthetase [Pelodictyon luteolum DSM 273]